LAVSLRIGACVFGAYDSSYPSALLGLGYLTSQYTPNPCVVSPPPVLDMRVKQGESLIWLFLSINLPTAISMERSRRELSNDMVIHSGIFTTLRSSSVLPSHLK